ncbi:TetR/AcrR family transcriptional regulator [Sphingobium algorifonticola]|uniref:TetR/AcrR family transcriptional regulator n=1 Tax=Sphingobium algorifonticola TaxID=2008318 RepID=A0A437J8W2_9SPHN|nr:TetR/AcrR family transcriptional regulator [Sphingobium algorifonticola]RVT41939.1 TetR/AcrR family transcriptional regulator [Sphingobium algorifonticola]
MTRSRTKTKDRATAREEICQTAMKLFAEQGYQAVTMRAIASQLGSSTMRTYRYFSSKHEIFASVREFALIELAKALDAATAGCGDSVDRLRTAFAAYADFSVSRPDEYALAFEIFPDTAEGLSLDNQQTFRSWQICLAAAEASCLEGKLVGDPVVITHALWCSVHGAIELNRKGRLIFGMTFDQIIAFTLAAGIDHFRPRR